MLRMSSFGVFIAALCMNGLTAVACRSGTIPGEVGASDDGAGNMAERNAARGTATCAGATPSASNVNLDTTPLPKLKPIGKPFPEGPSDEALCEAIHSRETNLWERFGHFIPVYRNGVIWVGDGDDNERKATEAAIATYAPRNFVAEGRACKTGGVLFYVGRLKDGHRDALGNTFFIHDLEATALKANPVVSKTMAQRFRIEGAEGLKTYRKICEADADECEHIAHVDNPPGFCPSIVDTAQEEFSYPTPAWGTRHSRVFDAQRLKESCERLSSQDKICLFISKTSADYQACWRRLAPQLGL